MHRARAELPIPGFWARPHDPLPAFGLRKSPQRAHASASAQEEKSADHQRRRERRRACARIHVSRASSVGTGPRWRRASGLRVRVGTVRSGAALPVFVSVSTGPGWRRFRFGSASVPVLGGAALPVLPPRRHRFGALTRFRFASASAPVLGGAALRFEPSRREEEHRARRERGRRSATASRSSSRTAISFACTLHGKRAQRRPLRARVLARRSRTFIAHMIDSFMGGCARRISQIRRLRGASWFGGEFQPGMTRSPLISSLGEALHDRFMRPSWPARCTCGRAEGQG
jgi:hypothetical protein